MFCSEYLFTVELSSPPSHSPHRPSAPQELVFGPKVIPPEETKEDGTHGSALAELDRGCPRVAQNAIFLE